MKKNQILLIIILAALGILGACSKSFLDVKPKGALSEDVLATSDGVNALLIGAYSLLDGCEGYAQYNGWESASSNWVYGDIRGLEASKGSDAGDQPDINPIMTFSETATNPYLNDKWKESYEAIARCNNTINVANIALANGAIDQATHDSYVIQARALRGWYHFELYRMFLKIPYVSTYTDVNTVTNSSTTVPDSIFADLNAGIMGLPTNMTQVGRFNKTVCQILLAKAMMQINHDYTNALPLLSDAITNGTKPNGQPNGLDPAYGEIFDIEHRNGIESVFTVQYSVNDGSGGLNAGWGEILNFPYKSGGSPGGCCGFFDPTQEFVNSFRTFNGLPDLDYAVIDQPGVASIKNDYGLATTDPFTVDTVAVDPRLDWAVGRRGIPYWDWGLHTGVDWVRYQNYSGPYNPKNRSTKNHRQDSLLMSAAGPPDLQQTGTG